MKFSFSKTARHFFRPETLCLLSSLFVLFAASFVLITPRISFAETVVAATSLNVSTTWDEAGSPYIIHTGLNIGNGATLSIDPGVTVKFDYGAHIDGLGRVRAVGTPENPIIFTSLDSALGGGDGSLSSTGWYIDIGTQGGVTTTVPFDFEHVRVSHSSGVYFSGGPSYVRDLSVSDSDAAIRFFNSDVDLDGLTLSNVAGGLGMNRTYNVSPVGLFKNIEAHHSGSLGAVLAFGSLDVTLSHVLIADTKTQQALLLQSGTLHGDDISLIGGLGRGVEINNTVQSVGDPVVADIHFSSTTISGFGFGAVRVNGGNLTILQSKIIGNNVGIDVRDPSYLPYSHVNISSSTLSGNGTAISSIASNQVNAVNNYWGDQSGPHYNGNPAGLGDSLFGNVLASPWLTSDPFLPPPPLNTKPDPVIIIPGLLGSAEKNGVWMIDPIFHVYDNLIETLKANGYTEGVDLFTLPYDWRQSNVDTAILLRNKIAAIRTLCNCFKVDLVAHSMGGLVARQYIQSPDYAHDVDQLIFLGTPQLGAPKDYLTWEAGESSKDASDRFIKATLSLEALKAFYFSLYNYIHNKPIPSFQELLPTTDYLHDLGVTTLKTYPTNYPRNVFLENLNANVYSLLNSGVNITNIVGDTGTSTISTIRIRPSTLLPLWQDGIPDGFNSSTSTDNGLELGKGDGTVTLQSAEFVNKDINVLNSVHTKLPTDAESLVYKKLTSKEPITLINKLQFFRMFSIKILSPVDVQVIAPDGKKIGKDFATGNEFSEIPDAFYSGFIGDDEYVTIPDPLDGEYKVITQGTGNGGEYTVATSLITDTSSSEADFSGQTTVGQITPISIPVDTDTNTVTIAPVDNIPPVISILSPQAIDYVRATSTTLTINASVTDPDSGVFSFGMSLNGTSTQNGALIDTYAQKLGNQVFVASSTDNVGNATTTSLTFRITTTPQATINDVERAFSLGWIGKIAIKNDIISKLNQAIKIEKKIVTVEEKLPGKPKVIKQIEKLEARLDKVLGKAILKDLDAKYPKSINAQAYSLLVEDINWLINN